MKAMLFAAGLGTRLRPITDTIPKALVPVKGVTLLERSFRYLIHAGIDTIVVNVHHHADLILRFLSSRNNFGITVHISDETDMLLETGGGLRKAKNYFGGSEPFIIYNCDVITSLDLPEMVVAHQQSGAAVTLAVRQRETSRYFLFDPDYRLCGWENIRTGEKIVPVPVPKLLRGAFSGIHIMQPEVLQQLPEKDVFSLVEFYLNSCTTTRIHGYYHTGGYWTDVGKPEELARAESYLP